MFIIIAPFFIWCFIPRLPASQRKGDDTFQQPQAEILEQRCTDTEGPRKSRWQTGSQNSGLRVLGLNVPRREAGIPAFQGDPHSCQTSRGWDGRQGGPGPGLLSSWKVSPADDLLGALAFTYAPLPVFLFLFCCLSFTFGEHVSRSRPRTLIRTTPSPTGYLIPHSLRSVVYSPISFSFFLLLLLS